jgi:hypothetical protein
MVRQGRAEQSKIAQWNSTSLLLQYCQPTRLQHLARTTIEHTTYYLTTNNYHYHSSRDSRAAWQASRCARVAYVCMCTVVSTTGRTLLSVLTFTFAFTSHLPFLPPCRVWLKMTAAWRRLARSRGSIRGWAEWCDDSGGRSVVGLEFCESNAMDYPTRRLVGRRLGSCRPGRRRRLDYAGWSNNNIRIHAGLICESCLYDVSLLTYRLQLVRRLQVYILCPADVRHKRR